MKVNISNQITLLLLFQVLILTQATHLVTSPTAEAVHTIVIGAGIAGTSAANTIATKGKSVIILEANDYIGGRLKYADVQLSNNETFKFEEGGNWIHGSGPENPLT